MLKDEHAFPRQNTASMQSGLTKREFYAAVALHAFIVCSPTMAEETAKNIDKVCVRIADKICEELEKEAQR